MNTINELIGALLIVIPSMALLRGLYCLGKMTADEDMQNLYKTRLVNLLIFTAIAETITGFLYAVFYYIF